MDTLESLKKAVFNKQVVLARVYHEHGHKTLAAYAAGWEVGASRTCGPVAACVFNILERLYGSRIAEEATAQLRTEPLVSTIDHHGILNHPFFINANLIFAQRKQKYLICFPTAGVSFNNTTSWSGCLLATNPSGLLERFSFFRDRQKNQTVFAASAFSLRDVDRVRDSIESSASFSKPEKEKLTELVRSVFGGKGVQSFPDFSSQAAIVSARLWQAIFPQAPAVLYVPLEELVTNIILKEIVPSPEHVLHRLLFTETGWNGIEKHYRGTLGAFSHGHKGSFLFWGIDEKNRRVHLLRQGNRLAQSDSRAGTTLKNIVPELAGGRLYPTSLVCFLVLLYYGITAIGGFNQVNWLTEIKEKFVGLLQEVNQPAEARRIGEIPTEHFAEGSLAFCEKNGRLSKATGLDLFLSPPGAYGRLMELATRVTVGESIESELPEIYKVIVPREAWDIRLSESHGMNQGVLANKLRQVI